MSQYNQFLSVAQELFCSCKIVENGAAWCLENIVYW